MGDRSGLGLIDVAVLEALSGRGARRGRAFRRSSTVLTALAESTGLAQGYGYEFLVDLAQPWKTPVVLSCIAQWPNRDRIRSKDTMASAALVA